MDIDVLAGSVQTLRRNAYKILNDGCFQRSLRSFGIADIEVNDPAKVKQTETTQRFQSGLITPAGHRSPTKVEFSQRSEFSDGESESALVDTEIARVYRQLSFRCPHYTGAAAVVQKVRALAGQPDYKGQVVEYLEAESRQEYGGKKVWNSLQNQVLNQLEVDA